MSYNRITKMKSTPENTKIVYNGNGFAIFEKELIETLLEEHNRLWELENKIENGTLIELPKKCYEILTHDFSIEEHDILEIRFNALTCKPTRIRVRKGIDIENFTYASIGKWIFLTKAEAEAKLKELQKDDV